MIVVAFSSGNNATYSADRSESAACAIADTSENNARQHMDTHSLLLVTAQLIHTAKCFFEQTDTPEALLAEFLFLHRQGKKRTENGVITQTPHHDVLQNGSPSYQLMLLENHACPLPEPLKILAAPVSGAPETRSLPLSKRLMRLKHLKNVDLPAPDYPSNTTN